MTKKAIWALVVALVAMATFIEVSSSATLKRKTPALPENALSVPIVPQANDFSCGAAVMLSVLYYWRVYDGTEVGLYKALDTTEKDGTEPQKLVEVAKSYGLDAAMIENLSIRDLRGHLDAGKTVILAIQAWRESED